LIPVKDIEKVYGIIDRELAFIELRNFNHSKKKEVMSNWLFVRDTFKEVCLQCAKAEGIL